MTWLYCNYKTGEIPHTKTFIYEGNNEHIYIMKKNIIFKAIVKNSNVASATENSHINAEGVQTKQSSITVDILGLANGEGLDEPTRALFNGPDFKGQKWVTVFTLDQRGNTTAVPNEGQEVYVRFSPFVNRETGKPMESYTLTGAPIVTVSASESALEAAMQLMEVEEEAQ